MAGYEGRQRPAKEASTAKFDHVSFSPRLQSGGVANRVNDADECLDLLEIGSENGAVAIRIRTRLKFTGRMGAGGCVDSVGGRGQPVNAAIEIHDSELAAVILTQVGVIVRLAPAYVHRSGGRPGFDAGSGWCQPVELVFVAGVVVGLLPELPCTLDDGIISGGAEFRGMIPLPYVVETAVHFEACNLHGDLVVIRGLGLEVKAIGEASYVEEFPGM